MVRILLILLVVACAGVMGNWSSDKNSRDRLNFVIDSQNSINVGNLRDYDDKHSMRKASRVPFVGKIPPAEDGAGVARYIVRNSVWGSLASLSTMTDITGFPFTDVCSLSDGPPNNSTGVPYFYMTPLDLTAKNFEKDPRGSLSMTLAEGNYCVENNFDPEDPRCAHVVLTGKVVKVKTGTDEEIFAQKALFTRHPSMRTWPKDHNWFFAKLEIQKISLLDYFGGVKIVNVDEYFHAGS
ncbi:protein CREG1 [Ischnura elegans]|uniref:protein CREG1 n=1 Tax=Ischnura elegans TaxID=197161 RepID=UPI001ED89C34|nr:protein CREG1 [Ischnura elegans]